MLLQTFLFFIPFPVSPVSVLVVWLAVSYSLCITSHVISCYKAVICKSWRLHTCSDCIALCQVFFLCYDNVKCCVLIIYFIVLCELLFCVMLYCMKSCVVLCETLLYYI